MEELYEDPPLKYMVDLRDPQVQELLEGLRDSIMNATSFHSFTIKEKFAPRVLDFDRY